MISMKDLGFIAEDSRPFGLLIGAWRAQICFDLCNDGTNTHFGTQYGKEVCMYVCPYHIYLVVPYCARSGSVVEPYYCDRESRIVTVTKQTAVLRPYFNCGEAAL